MPTKNRRVATYLPKEIDERFAAFKSERGIEGDSQALVTILSEFLGVTQQVAQQVDYQSNLVTKDEIEEINSRVAYLSEQVQGFDQQLALVVSRAISELRDELLSELPQQKELSKPSPDQLNLLDKEQTSRPSELQHDSQSELLSLDLSAQGGWMTTKEAFEVLKPDCSYRTFRGRSPEELHTLYGLQVDPQRKKESKYNARWLKLPVDENLLEIPQSELPSELSSELSSP